MGGKSVIIYTSGTIMTERELLKSLSHAMELTRHKKGLTQKEMAEKLQISESMYKKTLAGQRSGTGLLYPAFLLSQISHKSFYELLNLPLFSNNGKLIMEIVTKLSNLSITQLKYIKGIVEFEAAFMEDPSDQDDYITVLQLTGNFEDGMIYDSSNVYKVNARHYRKIFGESLHCGLEITSNHLSPVYHTGDILLICQRPPRYGDTGIFIDRATKRAYIRKFFQDTNVCRLEPLTGYGQTIYVNCNDTDDMNRYIKFGFVLTKMRI